VTREHWTEEAACKGRDTNLWFPGPEDHDAGYKARLICASCPVAQECRDWAGDSDGIHGGLSVSQRREGMAPEVALEDARRRAQAASEDARARKRAAAAKRRANRTAEQKAAYDAYQRKYRAETRERARQYRKGYYQENRARELARQREYDRLVRAARRAAERAAKEREVVDRRTGLVYVRNVA
jgi:hypothetical protein